MLVFCTASFSQEDFMSRIPTEILLEDNLDICSLKYEMQENNQKPLIELNGKVKME